MAAEDAVEAIHRAVRRGDTESVAEMLYEEPWLLSTMWKGDPPLTQAAYTGHVGVVSLLIERGADVSTSNECGNTALHLAAMRGHEEVVKTLLASGADPSARGILGCTALMYAADFGREAVIRLLLRHMEGCGLDERDEHGYTALWYAFSSGHVRVAQVLLLAGADYTAGHDGGWRLQHIATSHKHPHCAAVIQWWEGELERASMIQKARTLHEHTATHQQAPAAPVPAYLRARVQAGNAMPSVEVGAIEQDRMGVKRMREGEGGVAARCGNGKVLEGEVGAMVGYVVRDLNGQLYTELMQGLRLQ